MVGTSNQSVREMAIEQLQYHNSQTVQTTRGDFCCQASMLVFLRALRHFNEDLHAEVSWGLVPHMGCFTQMIQDVDLFSVKKRGENQGIFWIPCFFLGSVSIFGQSPSSQNWTWVI
jgi:hypothetical protein